LVSAVDAGGGLVEEEEARAGREGTGDVGALELAAGEGLDGAVLRACESDAGDHRVCEGDVGGVVASEHAGLADEAEADDLADGQGEYGGAVGVLREVADDAALADGLSGGHAGDGDGAVVGAELAEEELEERRRARGISRS
jgi:hypothetical protein